MFERSPFQQGHEERHRRPSPSISEHRLPRELESADELRRYRGKSREEYAEYAEALQGPEAGKMFARVCQLAEVVKAAGGRALLIGGSVRDEVLGLPSKDFDVEVYGMAPDVLEAMLAKLGRVDAVGKSFGILKLIEGGMDIDVSIPRRDSKLH